MHEPLSSIEFSEFRREPNPAGCLRMFSIQKVWEIEERQTKRKLRQNQDSTNWSTYVCRRNNRWGCYRSFPRMGLFGGTRALCHRCRARKVTKYLPDWSEFLHFRCAMTPWADMLWSLMERGKYYSIRDLASISGQPGAIVAGVVASLMRDGFVKRIGATEPLFTRSSIVLAPSLIFKILQSELLVLPCPDHS